MEMRKFIVEIHPDGRVYATEYEEPAGSRYATENDDPAERLDIRDALRKVDLECCREMGTAWHGHEKYAVDALGRVERLIELVLTTYWK